VDVAEYKRMFRVLDQMLSAHGDLRDRYRRLSSALTLLIMGLSIVAVMLALTDHNGDVTVLGVTAEGTVWLGVLAGCVFFLSITELVVDWRRRAWQHDSAARQLGELKGRFRRAHVDGDTVDTYGIDLEREYNQTMSVLVEIPNKLFNRLKARHRRKVAVSQLLGERPGAPVFYLRWLVLREGVNPPPARSGREEVLEESPPGSAQTEDDPSQP
jgi:hypothetical protein